MFEDKRNTLAKILAEKWVDLGPPVPPPVPTPMREHFFLKKKQKRNDLNCDRIIADQQKLNQFLLVALRSDNSPHYT